MPPTRTRQLLRYGTPFVLLLVIGAFLYLGLYQNPTLIESPLIGKKAPEFSLPDLHDPSARVGSEKFGGDYVLLNVWGSWCRECRIEHPFLMSLADSGVQIYGIDMKEDANGSSRAQALKWLDVLGNPYAAVAEDQVGDVTIDYGVYGAPETFLIAPDKTILAKQIGAMTPDVWKKDFLPHISAGEGG
jgi:cytochrome c biogenesis protein CcmG, thiol:disulfide interchange protein DsbE